MSLFCRKEKLIMEWELAPPSKDGNYKLVATQNINGDIRLTIIGENEGSFQCKLHEVGNFNEDLQEYINGLLPKIESGIYDIALIEDGI